MANPPFVLVECERPKEIMSCQFVDFLADSRTVISVSTSQVRKPGMIALSDAETGKLLKRISIPPTNGTIGAWISPDRTTLAVADKQTDLVDTRTLALRPALSFPAYGAVCFSKDGKLLAAMEEMTLRVFTIKDLREIASLNLESFVTFLSFLNDSDLMIVQDLGPLLTWNYRTGKTNTRAKETGCYPALSPDGKMLVAFHGTGPKKPWKLVKTDTTRWKSETSIYPGKICHCSVSPDSKRLVIAAEKNLLILDLAEDETSFKWMKPNYQDARSAAFSPDGQRLACILDSELHILDFRGAAKAAPVATPTLKAGVHACVHMVGPDDVMDRQNGYRAPLNALPANCKTCGMVNLDFVAKPYFLGKKIESPVDMAPAVAGNFLVRDSMKRALEAAAPGQCHFYPTVHARTKQPTPWFLAVPRNSEMTDQPVPPKCPKCGETWDYEGSDLKALSNPASKHDVFKSRNWTSESGDFEGWQKKRPEDFAECVDRRLYLSIRLETLIKKLGLRGMVRSSHCKTVPTDDDLAWAEDKVHLLKGVPKESAAGKTTAASDGFENYLKRNSKPKPVSHDFAAVEMKHGVQLPESYKAFMSRIGPKTFKDVDGDEGFCVHILPPKKLKFADCRGRDEDAFKGVLFATTDHGDGFYFALSGKGSEYEVRKFDHEVESYEPYTKNFAACILQFVG